MHQEDKYPTADDIDKIICAEIPNPSTNPQLHQLVKDSMIHGPCGLANVHSPCMKEGKCSKHFPKKFTERTFIGEDGYAVYRRRNDGQFIDKKGVKLDNRFVVPYNAYLLMRYQAHINVEWCNQSKSIRYLFKYVSKGHDRVTAALYRGSGQDGNKNEDEIKSYYDCRYNNLISLLEICT